MTLYIGASQPVTTSSPSESKKTHFAWVRRAASAFAHAIQGCFSKKEVDDLQAREIVQGTLPTTPAVEPRVVQESPFGPYLANELCNNPYPFYESRVTSFHRFPRLISPELLSLRLCHCHKLVGSARVFLEGNAIELLEQTHPKDKPLTVVSVGPGGCYQEFVYLAKLAKAGYKKIRLILIDPQVMPVESFRNLFENHLPESSFRVVHYRSLDQYRAAAHGSPDLLLLLDLSDVPYNVNGQMLQDYAFSFLHQNHLLTKKSVIAYSNVVNENVARVACCSYDGVSKRLYDIPNQRDRMPQVDMTMSAALQ